MKSVSDPLLGLVAYNPLPKFTTWHQPTVIQPYSAIHRSFADWTLNLTSGCAVGCVFCNVAESSMKFQKGRLSIHGIDDAVREWGEYLFVRDWDEREFRNSLHRAEITPNVNLSAGGHRAILISSATDAYQEIRNVNAKNATELNQIIRINRRRALELIYDRSTLNVRICTRNSSVLEDFDLCRKFGPRLMLGMSIPTVREDLSRFYEPNAPLPAERLSTLQAAKECGISIFVVVSPMFPECSAGDMRNTLEAVRAQDPCTIFCEPLRLRPNELRRVESHAAGIGFELSSGVFATDETWTQFAVTSLINVHAIARDLGIESRIHLWPDKSLGLPNVIQRMPKSNQYKKWIRHWSSRISEWPAAK